MTILVSGCAGFIGYHLTKRLLAHGHTIIGIDNLNRYYDPALKYARLSLLEPSPHFTFIPLDITDRTGMETLFQQYTFKQVVHLAAQAGVRYAFTDPYAYLDSNLQGFGHILENCRQQKVQHLIFASSSSVYGTNTQYPFQESQSTDHPCSLYGATKKANELMAHSYSQTHQLPCTGLRFFTVYGPWGRPDMALFQFTQKILNGESIDVYNHGHMARDFTYIEDIIDGMMRVLEKPRQHTNPYQIYNIGRGQPIALLDFIELLEKRLNKQAKKNMLPMQPGDMEKTFADTTLLEQAYGYQPKISIEEGIAHFVDWYKQFYM